MFEEIQNEEEQQLDELDAELYGNEEAEKQRPQIEERVDNLPQPDQEKKTTKIEDFLAAQANPIAKPVSFNEDQEMEPVEQTPAFFAGAQDLPELDHLRLLVESRFEEQQVSQVAKQNNSFLRTFANANNDYESTGNQNLLIPQLKQVLQQEKISPELLPYQTKLIGHVMKLISRQEAMIAAKNEQKSGKTADSRSYMNMYKMELERVKYVLKAYLRARILKIEANLFYIVEKDKAHLMSEAEMNYAWMQYESRKEHFKSELFDHVTTALNSMAEGKDMDDQLSKYTLF